MAKKWIKLWVAESLRGTIRFDLTSEERGVWFDLLAMAADGRHESYIAPNMDQGYPDAWVAATLNIPLKLLQRVISKCLATGRLEKTKFGLHITNWSRYQSEYDRQKPYRQQKSLDELNQEHLAAHPEEITGSVDDPSYDTEEVYEGDEPEELARGNESLDEHEEAMRKANPGIRL